MMTTLPGHTAQRAPESPPASVLIVDDEVFFREVIREGLEESGYKVYQAEDGSECLNEFREHHPDVVLLDLRMPKMDGLSVLSVLSNESPETPIIVVSGAGAMRDALEALRLGAWDYILKPVELEVLRHAVRRAVERQRLLRENQRHNVILEATVRQRTAELEKRTKELEHANTALRHQIQERKRVEQERERLEADLRQAQKMEAIGTLASGVAHDFNNLLTSIIGNLSLLREEAAAPNAQRFITEAENACLRATGLVKQMLALSRKTEPGTLQIDVNEAVDEVQRLVRETFDRRIEFFVDKADGLPSVLADPARINSLLLNLCVNARDAVIERLQQQTEGAPPVARITVRTREKWIDQSPNHANVSPGWYVVLSVVDTGVGIAEEVRPRIFEPYFTTKPVDKGTGLGLSVVYGIVRQMGGWIDVQTSNKAGTTFAVYLPVAQATEAPASPGLAYRATAPEGAETLLIVDDEASIREISEEYLSRLGYRVLVAADGQEGLHLFEQEHDNIDLMILDLSMPKVSGNEMLRQVRQRAPGIKAIISSGTADAPSHVTERVEAFVLKPFRPTELAEKIREVLDA